jgi:formylglycine-generating enzyme required for sulfatase activity
VSRHGCARSIVPLTRLPGYANRDHPPTFTIDVPTCEATRRDTIEIEAGPFLSGGLGEPPIVAIDELSLDQVPPERTVSLSAFAIDRTEVSNAAFQLFTAPSHSTAMPMPAYPPTFGLENAASPSYPVANVTWSQARAYCRFIGKDLPSDEEWEKSLRGGLRIHGQPNPMPRRTVPWGVATRVPANVKDTSGEQLAPIDANPGDASPYGVLDLAGNVQEWTRTPSPPSQRDFYAARGCSPGICTRATLPSMLAIPNIRAAPFRSFDLGFRCVIE